MNAQVPDPNPEDLRISYLELTEQDLAKEARYEAFGIVPMDDEQLERDYHRLVEAGWIERPRLHKVKNGVAQFVFSRVNLHSQIYARDWTTTPPRQVKAAFNNGCHRYDWGNRFVYFKYDDDARAYRDAQPRGWEVQS